MRGPEIIDSNARPTALGYRSNGGFYKDAGAMPLAIKCYNDEGHRPEIIDSNARPMALGYRSNGGFYKDAGAMPLAIKCYNAPNLSSAIVISEILQFSLPFSLMISSRFNFPLR